MPPTALPTALPASRMAAAKTFPPTIPAFDWVPPTTALLPDRTWPKGVEGAGRWGLGASTGGELKFGIDS